MGAGAVSALELHDIQGLVARGYGNLPSAALPARSAIEDAAAGAGLARRRSRASLTSADAQPGDAGGQHRAHELRPREARARPRRRVALFSNEFVDGMTTPHRTRILGDLDENAPGALGLGRPADAGGRRGAAPLRPGRGRRSPTLEREQAGRLAAGCRSLAQARHVEPRRPRAVRLPRRHLAAVRRGPLEAGPARDDAALGEFVLGYPNEYGRYTDQPLPRRPPATSAATAQLPRLPPAAPGRPRLLELRRPARRGAPTGAPTPSAGCASPRRWSGAGRAAHRSRSHPTATTPRSRRRTTSPTSSTTGTARAARSARTSGARIRATRSIRNRERQSRGRSTGATGSCAAAASTDRRSS